jgi:hypothetical protein
MKLWFEGWKVNAPGRVAVPADTIPAAIAAPPDAIKSLAAGRPQRDSAANDF